MELFVKVLVCFLAGAGAGIGTGFAGMSAAAVIGPMLITFLDIPAYSAVGIGLASDVLASAVSAYTYKKNQNLDVKNGLVMMAFVLLFTMVGSFVASLVPNSTMGNFTVFMTMLLGVKFIVKPVMTTREAMEAIPRKTRMIKSVIGGIVIGFICGFVGAGGGMMMLLVLTTLLGYELKCAVGTSVFVMTFTALTGAVSHIVIGGVPDVLTLVLCVVFTFIWARIAATIANRAQPKTLNRVTGVVLLALGVVVLGVHFL
ncbi:MAG: sulfite exporter TauE/SafE family protein [Oscillospiraceae bacterium]|nr:sulfite exporter TauE/SafE family protein [Oscillospiraceae bacterium]